MGTPRRPEADPAAHHPATPQRPLPGLVAWSAVARCAYTTVGLLARRRVHLPRTHVGERIRFADGTGSWVYRETTVDHPELIEPAVLVVGFKLRWVRGFGHDVFRLESLLNTPLFVGFPGFVAKLWLAHDQSGMYRGIYQWDGRGLAVAYARALWRVLALVSEPGSIRYHVLPDLRRDEWLGDADMADPDPATGWWRPTWISN